MEVFPFYGGKFTLLPPLIKPNFAVTLPPPTQQHSFFRSLPSLFWNELIGKIIYRMSFSASMSQSVNGSPAPIVTLLHR